MIERAPPHLRADEDVGPVEVPEVLDPLRDASSVRPIHDGVQKRAGLSGLRRRLRAGAAGAARARTLDAGGPRRPVGSPRHVGGLAAGALGLGAGLAALLLPPAVVAAIALGADRLRSAPGPLHGRPVVAAWTLAFVAACAGAALATAVRRRRRGRGPGGRM